MNTIRGVVKNGEIEWLSPTENFLREGARVEVRLLNDTEWESIPDNGEPLTPDQIAKILAHMETVRGPWLDPEDMAAWEQSRAEHKTWELAQWDERSKKLREMWP